MRNLLQSRSPSPNLLGKKRAHPDDSIQYSSSSSEEEDIQIRRPRQPSPKFTREELLERQRDLQAQRQQAEADILNHPPYTTD